MSVKGFRRMLLGEDMPDKDDPKYKERREKELAAGRKFAKVTGIDRLAAWVQSMADRNRVLFLVVVFGFVACCFGWNVYRMAKVYGAGHTVQSGIERQEQVLENRHHKIQEVTEAAHCAPPKVTSVNPKEENDEDNRKN